MEWKSIWKNLADVHHLRTVGALLGLIFGVLLVTVGSMDTLLVLLFLLLGWFIGRELERRQENADDFSNRD